MGNSRGGQQQSSGDQLYWITEIQPRHNYIIRRASNLSKQAHILGANLTRTLLIATISYPITTTIFIDRYLATATAYGVPAVLVFNKVDRYRPEEQQRLRELMALYNGIGVPACAVSATKGEGLDELRGLLNEGITLIAGHSGVGKSTLINALVPRATLATAAISEAHNQGVHTTTSSRMIPFGEEGRGAYLIDTPGIKGFGTIEFEREEVGHYFPEIFRASQHCRYNNCTHTHEPACAVLEAFKAGNIASSRYKSYLSILYEEEEGKYR